MNVAPALAFLLGLVSCTQQHCQPQLSDEIFCNTWLQTPEGLYAHQSLHTKMTRQCLAGSLYNKARISKIFLGAFQGLVSINCFQTNPLTSRTLVAYDKRNDRTIHVTLSFCTLPRCGSPGQICEMQQATVQMTNSIWFPLHHNFSLWEIRRALNQVERWKMKDAH